MLTILGVPYALSLAIVIVSYMLGNIAISALATLATWLNGRRYLGMALRLTGTREPRYRAA